MTEDFREKLSLSRAGKSGSLAPFERELVEGDPLLREEVELNRVLEQINQETRTSPPPMNHMLKLARSGARSRSKRSYAYQRLLWYIEEKLPLTPPQLVQRTALLVAVLVIWPLVLSGIGGMLKRYNAADPVGDTSEVYRLTYAIQLPMDADWSGSTTDGEPLVPGVVRGAEVVCSEMMTRFADWSERYPELTRYASYRSYLHYEDLFKEQLKDSGKIGVVRIELLNEEGEILPDHLQELAELFDEMPEVGECVVDRVSTVEAAEQD